MKLPDYLDEAIIGVGSRCEFEDVLVYDTALVIKCFVASDGMTEEEAWEHFDYNVLGSYVGDTTPIFVLPYVEDE
jgi:hypothetical protein